MAIKLTTAFNLWPYHLLALMALLSPYNQRLKAIIGTLILVGVGLLILAGGYALIDDIISTHFRKNAKDNALIANDQDGSDGLNTKAAEQEISFSKPRLIDTLNGI